MNNYTSAWWHDEICSVMHALRVFHLKHHSFNKIAKSSKSHPLRLTAILKTYIQHKPSLWTYTYIVHCFIYNVYIIIFYGIKELKNVFHECHLVVDVVENSSYFSRTSCIQYTLGYIYKYVWMCSLEKSHVSHIFSVFIAANIMLKSLNPQKKYAGICFK